jgi:bacitracin synthase 3
MALCTSHGVTGCIVTPSYYQLLVTEFSASVPSLRWITLAGESATPQLVAAHLARLPGVALFNEYGPTENAVCSTACRLERVEPTVSIGRPIWNVKVFILDGQRRLCPIGAAGEIFLGGAGLARGYLNQPGLTAERFDASPIPEFHTGPLYRTGDRGCWRPDGSIEFLGRRDRQVKVRGFRIELDDVELALQRHPGVSNAAVICKDDPDGAKYLAAYAETHTGIAADELREHMRRQLPHYMIPDVVAMMPQLPLNLNGKVDRAALRLVVDFGGDETSALAPPVSPFEAALLVLWSGVLRRSQIGRDDNFFSIGGNSLRVMELTARIRGELSIDVGLLDIYTSPTITELAGRLSEMSEERNANRH